MQKRLRILATFLVLLAFASGNAFSAKAKQKVFRLGSASGQVRAFDSTVGIAQELGFLEEELSKVGYKIEYSYFENGIAINEAFIAGDIDAATIGDVPAFTGYANQIGTVWIGSLSSFSDIAILTRKESSIKKPKDLEGKNVAINIGTNAQFTFENYLTFHGVDRNKINIINLTLINHPSAFASGSIDAAFGSAPFLLNAAAEGVADEFYTTRQNPEWSCQGLILASKKFLKTDEKALVAFEKAVIRAREELIKNPSRWYLTYSGGAIAKHPELGERLYNRDNGRFRDLILRIGEQEIEKGQNLYNLLLKLGRYKTARDVKGFVNNSIYEQAEKELKAKGFVITE